MSIPNIDILCKGCFNELKSAGDVVCPYCGYNSNQATPLHQLKPTTILNGKYLVGRVLGEGGFGITYIGWDLNLHIKLAIKEYYPAGYVTREATTVHPFTGSHHEFFANGCNHFVEEARRLARFHSMPGIVAIRDFFMENKTAYIVMEYVEGKTLKTYLNQMNGKLPASQVLELIKPVITSLAEMHKADMIHRDISPDNIMITDEGNLKLLDFGAAREFTESGNKSLSIMLKPGYAPEEQYRSRGVQGPWTDIYSLCATIYKCITGITPDESANRVHSDEVKPPSALGVEIDMALESALMKGMAVLQNDRFQSLPELYAALYGQTSNKVSAVISPSANQNASSPVIQRISPKAKSKQQQNIQPKNIILRQGINQKLDQLKNKMPFLNKIRSPIAIAAIILFLIALIALSLILLNNFSSNKGTHVSSIHRNTIPSTERPQTEQPPPAARIIPAPAPAPTPAPDPNPATPPATAVPRGLEYIVEGRSVTIVKYTGDASTVAIPSHINGNPVNTIRPYAFQKTEVTGVTIPNTVTHIGNYAFDGCTNLTSVNIPNSVTYIGSQAFHGCSSLTSITIPNTITHIENYTFAGTGLTSVTIPNSVTYIGSGAFSGCPDLASAIIGNSVDDIMSLAFSGCSKLTRVTFNRSNAKVNTTAFTGDLPRKYSSGGTGTYTRSGRTWTKN